MSVETITVGELDAHAKLGVRPWLDDGANVLIVILRIPVTIAPQHNDAAGLSMEEEAPLVIDGVQVGWSDGAVELWLDNQVPNAHAPAQDGPQRCW